jgi:hypothetical protein
MRHFIRTCQECKSKQVDQEPGARQLTPAYQNRKCLTCQSEALDYGSEQETTRLVIDSSNASKDVVITAASAVELYESGVIVHDMTNGCFAVHRANEIAHLVRRAIIKRAKPY